MPKIPGYGILGLDIKREYKRPSNLFVAPANVCPSESELYSSRYSFTEEEDTFFEYTPGSGTTYEEILVPGGAFNFTG